MQTVFPVLFEVLNMETLTYLLAVAVLGIAGLWMGFAFIWHRLGLYEAALIDLAEKVPTDDLQVRLEKAHQFAVQVKASRDAMTQIFDITNPIHHYQAEKVVPDIHQLAKHCLAVLEKERLT